MTKAPPKRQRSAKASDTPLPQASGAPAASWNKVEANYWRLTNWRIQTGHLSNPSHCKYGLTNAIGKRLYDWPNAGEFVLDIVQEFDLDCTKFPQDFARRIYEISTYAGMLASDPDWSKRQISHAKKIAKAADALAKLLDKANADRSPLQYAKLPLSPKDFWDLKDLRPDGKVICDSAEAAKAIKDRATDYIRSPIRFSLKPTKTTAPQNYFMRFLYEWLFAMTKSESMTIKTAEITSIAFADPAIKAGNVHGAIR